MNLKDGIHLAGAIQLGIAAANFALPTKLHYRENLARVSPIIRQIFTVHAIYIVIVLVGFGTISLVYADDLLGRSALGTFLSGFSGGRDFKPMKSFEDWLSLALRLAGVGHFCLLIASFQMPHQLGWREDLQKLTAFNRKLMWVYGGFTLLTIVAFGILTLLLHDEFLHGERTAAALAGFIAIYWTARILVDFFYYDHADWPVGFRFVAGHFLLTALFIALATTYWAAMAHHFLNL